MKVLIAPMASIAPMKGPFSRVEKIALECRQRGHEVRLCSAEDVNYHPIEGVLNYPAPIPSPMGLPWAIGKNMFAMARRTGVQKRKPVRSYEEVLRITGSLSAAHFKQDVEIIRKAIRDFEPDIVYAEFRLEAVVAAKLEGRCVASGYSYPVRPEYASSPQYSRKVRALLEEYGLPGTNSILEVFGWADMKIIHSIYELEPIEEDCVAFTGPFTDGTGKRLHTPEKNKVLVYLGNGSIPASRQIRVLKDCFLDTEYKVHIAAAHAEEQQYRNISVARYFDFSRELPEAQVFINHGGQNSVTDGLLHGAPQLVFPGPVFERQYNGSTVEKNGVGRTLPDRDFTPAGIREALNTVARDPAFAENAARLGEKLQCQGGVRKAVDALEQTASAGRNLSGIM